MNTIISVITVCLNADDLIEKTIQSVLTQSSDAIEYIICDGGSKDNTSEIIKKSINMYMGKKRIEYVQQTDFGIYDAMNKAAKKSTAEWIIFLNAGDVFYSEFVLERFIALKKNGADIIYANTLIPSKGEWRNIHINRIKYMPVFCHQSVFVRAKYQKEIGFDINYRYAADYDFFLKLYLEGKKFLHFDEMVAIYDESGVSAINSNIVSEEYKMIQKKNRTYVRSWIYKLMINIKNSWEK